ncbi:MAG: CHASE2 domain-containing protein [Flavobacteriales bacterium]|nr:CHASE2 domain-containing protein [Flavobacteriales bacterium]
MKYLFRWDNVFCTFYIFGVIWLFSNIPIETEIFDPIAIAFEDFEISDMVYTDPLEGEEHKRLRKDPPADTNIVLVNIQFLSRAEIGKQIEILNKHNPKLIAIDAFFRKEKSPMQDFPLAMALNQANNLVLGSRLEFNKKYEEDPECFDTVSYSNPLFLENAQFGFVNVDASSSGEGFRTIKSFYPFLCTQDSIYPNFSSKIVEIYNKDAYDRLVKRGNETEIINWRGHYTKFYALDAHHVLNETFEPSIIKDKIVLMGYMGTTLGEYDLIDIFYTPLNHRPAGRAYPDTYGVVVHANIISMILEGNYIFTLPKWATNLILLIMAYLNVSLFLYVAEKRKMYYDLITKSLQITEIMLLMFLIVVLMLKFQTKVHFSLVFAAILISGDLTELYAGSLKPMAVSYLTKFGILKPKE